VCSLHKRESVPLLSLEEVDSLSRKRRECHLCKEERVCSLHKGGECLLLYTEDDILQLCTEGRVCQYSNNIVRIHYKYSIYRG